ncbi:MAG: carbohydrate ABC transporter permease, partial [Candidatus Bipolaricaulia bacterium]
MKNLNRNTRESITAFLMLLPALVGLGLFLLLPSVSAAVLGFTNYILGPIPTKFVGLHNFLRMFGDSTFIRSMLNTLYFAALVVPLQTTLSLGLALLVNRKLAGVNFFRAIYFFPTIMALVVVSVVWALLLNKGGVINGMLAKVGIGPIPFLTSTAWAMPSIVLASIWQGAGLQMVIFLSGLQAIP